MNACDSTGCKKYIAKKWGRIKNKKCTFLKG